MLIICIMILLTQCEGVLENVSQHENLNVGWNDEVIARTEFKFWKQNNMPRSGPVFRAMSSASMHSDSVYWMNKKMISGDKLAHHMQCHDEKRF